MTDHLDVVSDTSIFIEVMPPSRNGRRFTPQTSQPAGSQAEAVHSRSGIFAERPPREHRHWSPASQIYAPADVLAHLISDGWQVCCRLSHLWNAKRRGWQIAEMPARLCVKGR
jgi:hypothetical protein